MKNHLKQALIFTSLVGLTLTSPYIVLARDPGSKGPSRQPQDFVTRKSLTALSLNANGGRFSSLKKGQDQTLTKEVDLGRDLNSQLEKPLKKEASFIGWALKDQEGNLSPVSSGNLLDHPGPLTLYALWQEDVYLQEGDDKPHGVPSDYKKIYFNPGDKPISPDKKGMTFWVNPKKEVRLVVPQWMGLIETNAFGDGIRWFFRAWKLEGTSQDSISMTYGRKRDGLSASTSFTNQYTRIVGKFTQDTEYKATYKVVMEPILVPVLMKNPYIVPIGTKVKAKDLVINTNGWGDPKEVEKIPPLPEDTVFEYTDLAGFYKSMEAKTLNVLVRVIYRPKGSRKDYRQERSGQIIYVDHLVPQVGAKKAQVPDSYVKVTLEAVNKDMGFEKKVFWANPEVEVALPEDSLEELENQDPIKWTLTRDEDGPDQEAVSFNPDQANQFTEDTTIQAHFNPKDQEDQGKEDPEVKPGEEEEEPSPEPEVRPGEETEEPSLDPEVRPVEEVENPSPDSEVKPGEEVEDTKQDKDRETGLNLDFNKPLSPGISLLPGLSSIPNDFKEDAQADLVHEEAFVQGYNGYFRPKDSLSRAEAAQILANILKTRGFDYHQGQELKFKDIKEDTWYLESLKATSQAGLFIGDERGYFNPNRKLTRTEWIVLLTRLQGLDLAQGNAMGLDLAHWARGEVQAALNKGWLDIYTKGLVHFNSDEEISREEVVALGNKALKKSLDRAYIRAHKEDLVNFKDIDPSMWSYEDILCGANSFISQGLSYKGHKRAQGTYKINL